MFSRIFILALFLSAAFAHAQEYVPGEVIVRLKGDESSRGTFMGKAVSAKAMILEESFDRLSMHRFALRKGQTVEQAVAELKQDPEVLYAEPNYIFRKINESAGTIKVFTDAEILASGTSSLSQTATSLEIGVEKIWTAASIPANRPIVAVLDTGMDVNHRVLRETGAVWVNPGEIAGNGIDDDGNGYTDDVHGWNFVNNNGDVMDDDGHGTHVAGIVLAVDQNIFTSPLRQSRIQIMPVKFLNSSGVGNSAAAVRAIQYAIDNGATVINNSWGSFNASEALHEAMALAYDWGVLTVAAAGNMGTNNDVKPVFPASYKIPGMISVGAVTDYDNLASFSNFGPSSVHMASPGVAVLSLAPGDRFATASGTSMAAPFVSGTAAHAKVVSPDMRGYQIKSILLAQAAHTNQLNGKIMSSARLNAWNAVEFARTATVDPSQPPYPTAGPRNGAATRGGGCQGLGAIGSGHDPGNIIAVVILIISQIAVFIYMRRRARRKN